MKKIIILTAISLFAATSAFAGSAATIPAPTLASDTLGLSVWASTTVGGAASGTNLIGKTSTGVGVQMSTAATGYAVVTQHKNGTKAFGTSFDSTSLFTIPVTAGTFVTVTLTTNTSAGFSAWTSM